MSAQSTRRAIRLPLARYAWKELLAGSILLLGAAALTAVLGWWVWSAAAVVLLACGVWFFRDPERTAPAGDGVLVAPADGRVVEIAEVDEPEHVGGRALRVSIFLSIFDVHVNRSPCAGVVKDLKYRRGRFRNALRAVSSEQNESNVIVIEREGERPARLVVRQIAGAIARRIVCDCRAGEPLRAGQRLGMIKFGSRTELYIPLELPMSLEIEVGQHVKGGSTIIGRVR